MKFQLQISLTTGSASNQACFFLLVTVMLITAVSCQTVADLADTAGSWGMMDPNRAAAVSTSARAIGSAAEEINPEQEYFVGRAVAANILTAYSVWNENPGLTAYLNRICLSLAINSPRPDIYNGYRVAILDSEEINAFATPGGHILVTRGLINSAKSEDALAAVIAHEIGHIQLKHGIKAIKNSRITNAILVTGTATLGAAAGMDVEELTSVMSESVGEIVQTMVSNGYSRNQEYDADNSAIAIMASSGYNPSALIEMLESLPSSGSSGFGKTHPQPSQRIANARKTLAKIKAEDTSSVRKARFTAATM